jgi:hypothetical protein
MAFSTVMQLGITCVVMFMAAFMSGMLPLLIEVSRAIPSLMSFMHVIEILTMQACSIYMCLMASSAAFEDAR